VIQDDDFVVHFGTLIYRGQTGRKASELIYEDYLQGKSISQLRARMIGSYACVLNFSGELRLFVDELGTYFIYYYSGTDGFVLTNTYLHIAKVIDKFEINVPIFLAQLEFTSSGNLTLYHDIFRLMPDECFTVTKKGIVDVKKIMINEYPMGALSLQDAVAELTILIKKYSKIRSNAFNKFMIFLTGGLDSRVEFATHQMDIDDINTTYWIGEDTITNGYVVEAKIASELARKTNASFECIDVAMQFDSCIVGIDEKRINKYGEYADLYASNTKWFEIFEHLPNSEIVFETGYLGETMRNLEHLNVYYHDSFSLHEFIEKVVLRSNIIGKHIGEREPVIEILKQCWCEYVSDENNLSVNDCKRLFNKRRYYTDMISSNFFNIFAHSFSILAVKEISDYINGIPYEWIHDNEKLPINLIRELNPSLLSVPICSHGNMLKYKRGSNELQMSPLTLVSNFAKKTFRDTIFFTILKKFDARFIKRLPRHNQIQSKSVDIIKNSLIVNDCCVKIQSDIDDAHFNIGTIGTFAATTKVNDIVYNERCMQRE
jgi:hypothetical protein